MVPGSMCAYAGWWTGFVYHINWILALVCVHRVLQPPGGGSSNIFGGYEEDAVASRRPNKMASTIFAPAAEPQGGPKRSNPPGINIWCTKVFVPVFWVAGVKSSPHCNQAGCVTFPFLTLWSVLLHEQQVWITALIPEGHSQAGHSQSHQSQWSVLESSC